MKRTLITFGAWSVGLGLVGCETCPPPPESTLATHACASVPLEAVVDAANELAQDVVSFGIIDDRFDRSGGGLVAVRLVSDGPTSRELQTILSTLGDEMTRTRKVALTAGSGSQAAADLEFRVRWTCPRDGEAAGIARVAALDTAEGLVVFSTSASAKSGRQGWNRGF